jgi:ribosome-associated protein
MDIRKLQRAIVDGLEDVKAQHISVFNTEHLSPLFERVIIASGTSNRQTKALASSVRETVKGRGLQVLRTEGEENGEWIIVDCGAAVCHVMQPAIREYYRLEEIWGEKAVKLKSAAVPKGRAMAEAEREEAKPAAPSRARKAPAKKTSKTASGAASKDGAVKVATKVSKPAGATRVSGGTVKPTGAAKASPLAGKRPPPRRPRSRAAEEAMQTVVVAPRKSTVAAKSAPRKSPAAKAAPAGRSPNSRSPTSRSPSTKAPARKPAAPRKPPRG